MLIKEVTSSVRAVLTCCLLRVILLPLQDAYQCNLSPLQGDLPLFSSALSLSDKEYFFFCQMNKKEKSLFSSKILHDKGMQIDFFLSSHALTEALQKCFKMFCTEPLIYS